ncbi:MAG: hypothetical protein CSA23_02105 [Deltaproteobacteria bacterium]|nr:MAG: hypothetical protein CSA23_02105 [Deltaproteobacteria bacterium]
MVHCKHVAAALYGAGARLDEDPSLFFVLRKADVNDLVSETIKESKKDLLSKAQKKSGRIIESDAGLAEMFGIELDNPLSSKTAKKNVPAGRKQKKPEPVKSSPPKKLSKSSKPRKKATATDKVANILRRIKKGLPVSELIEKSGVEAQKMRNIVFRLKRAGRIENVSRGVYRWVG